MVVFGQIMLKLAFAATLLAVGAFLAGRSQGPKNGKGATDLGYVATFAAAGFYTVCIVLMTVAFFTKNFAFEYVALNMPYDVSSLAWLYKLSGVWAGREGSLLFWAWLISLFNAWVGYRRFKIADELSNMGVMVTNVILAIFSAAMIFSSLNDPFKATNPMLLDASGNLVGVAMSWGMNPLLEHWAMTAHPPTLFVGYAGLTIPFAFAVAALITRDGSKLWVDIVNRITVFSWLFLGIGIGLGSVWAYVVLGWGGYWAWDPVENASLLPWLIGVGLIHSFTIYRRRNGFKKWAVVNACATFSMVILGTFITRSGVVQSVHAFQGDPVSLYLFLSMVIAPIVIAIWGVMTRGEEFATSDEFDSLTSKDAAYYFNNVIMLVASVLIAYLTVSSALPAWMPFGGKAIAAATYDAVARPVGILYIGIIAFCPLLVWGKRAGKEVWARLKWPGLISIGVFALLMLEWTQNLYPNYQATIAAGGANARSLAAAGPAWYYNGVAILGLAVAALTVCTTLFLFIEGARKRAKATGTSLGASLAFIFTKARTQSGGYLAHLGMAIILIGLVGSNMYVLDSNYRVPLKEGESFQTSNYTLTYKGVDEYTLENGDGIKEVVFDVAKNGSVIDEARPNLQAFSRQGQTKQNVYVVVEPLRDIFVAAGNIDQVNGFVDINVKINPLISWAWAGFLLLSVGTVLAAIPSKREEPVPSAAARAKAKATAKR